MLEVRTEEIFRWIVDLSGSCKLVVLCTVGEPEESQNPHTQARRVRQMAL